MANDIATRPKQNKFNGSFETDSGQQGLSRLVYHPSNFDRKSERLKDHFLSGSKYCDLDHFSIQRLAAMFSDKAENERDLVRRAFYWVRDEIEYTMGIQSQKASDTLRVRKGSCSNKANLLVAILRACGIKSSYRVLRVLTKSYIGPANPPRFRQFASNRSYHIFAAFFDSERSVWISLDPSDDVMLASSIQHLSAPSTVVNFDGYNDARLRIDSRDIVEFDNEEIESLDDFLDKPRRVPDVVIKVANMYVNYMRREGGQFSAASEMWNSFFRRLEIRDPDLYGDFVDLEKRLHQKSKSGNYAESPSL